MRKTIPFLGLLVLILVGCNSNPAYNKNLATAKKNV